MAIYDVNAAIDKPNLFRTAAAGMEFGNQQRALREQRADESTLRQLAPKAMGGDFDALEQMAVIDPKRAASAQAAGNIRWETLKGGVQMVQRARDSGNPQAVQNAWANLRPFIQRATGTLPPEDWTVAAPHFGSLEAKLASIEGGKDSSELPTGFRERDMMLRAAGHQPGSPEYQRGMGMGTGLIAREVGAAAKTGTVKGLDGRDRPFIFDPTAQTYRVFDGNAWRPMGHDEVQQVEGLPQQPAAPLPLTPPIGQGGDVFASLKTSIPGLRVTDEGIRTPEQNAALPNSVPNSYHLTGQAIDIGTPTPEQQERITQWAAQNGFEVIHNYADGHWHLEPRGNAQRTQPAPQAAPSGGLVVSRSPEEQAALTKQAEETVSLQNLPGRGRIEAENAALKESATTTAKATAERETKLAQQALDQESSLELLNGAEVLLGRATGGMLEQGRDRLMGAFNQSTEGSRATAGLRVLAAKLVAKVPRMEGPQSDADRLMYQQAAGDLANDSVPVGDRLAALQTMRQIAQRYAHLNGTAVGGAPATPARIRYDAQGNRL